MTKNDKINFSTPSGFPEFLPSEKRLELHLLDIIRKVFESYGFIYRTAVKATQPCLLKTFTP